MSAPTTGLEIMQALAARRSSGSPIGETMGLIAVAAAQGEVTLVATPDQRHLNPAGAVHGGFAATCLDGAAALALFTTLSLEASYSTVDLNVKYLRPLQSGQTYQSRGWLVERTRSLAVCDADIRDADGKLYARASATLMVRANEAH